MILQPGTVTGQARLDSHLLVGVEVAVSLVNALTCRAQYGRPTKPPQTNPELRSAGRLALESCGLSVRVSDAQARELAHVAAQLRPIFEALAAGAVDTAAELINARLQDYRAHPRLDRHNGQPWHLHFHTSSAGLADAWGASTATGLAVVVGTNQQHRLGACDAPVCERVYFDLTRNGSRRFCSIGCQNRVKATAYRNRTAERRVTVAAAPSNR